MRMFAKYLLIGGLVLAPSVPSSAQQSCESFMCPNGAQATGDMPSCLCGNEVIDIEKIEAPSCEKDIQCKDPTFVATGTWPVCGCRAPSQPDEAPGGGAVSTGGEIPFHPGPGGIKACSDIFTCPPQMQMAVEDDTCICERP
ncbi:MAG: hypothetical protein INR68_07040 [Methylobacterium mesophilicum]|nr:hypothetical protein [Methylobacterium mesophilicum]